MSINLKNFVNVNIDYIDNTYDETNFGTVTLIWFRNNTAIELTTGEYVYPITEGVYTNYDDAIEVNTDAGFENYALQFFKNGGQSLKVVDAGVSTDTSYDVKTVLLSKIRENCASSTDIIICTNCPDADSIMIDLATDLPNTIIEDIGTDENYPKFNGKDSKILMYTVGDVGYADTGLKNLVFKLGYYITIKQGEDTFELLDGSCMAAAAYLSKMNFNTADVVKDYMYTEEYLPDYAENEDLIGSQNYYEQIKEFNVNVSTIIANKYVNLGGDTIGGYDLVNEFSLIVLENLLTTALYNLVIKKLKYNSITLSRAREEVASVLDQFVNNGYITPDDAWVDQDVIIDDLIIVSKGSRLQSGYVIYIAEMTPELRDAHKLPNIYIVLNDSTGIRYINVVGKVN